MTGYIAKYSMASAKFNDDIFIVKKYLFTHQGSFSIQCSSVVEASFLYIF